MDPKYPVVTEERKHDFEELKAFLEKEIAEDKQDLLRFYFFCNRIIEMKPVFRTFV